VVIVPHVDPEQPNPLTFQVTEVLPDPVTEALNCCWAPTFSCTLVGEILTLTCTGATIVTVVEPEIEELERDVAVTTTVLGFGAVDGAV
jgi:hypothetical protein